MKYRGGTLRIWGRMREQGGRKQLKVSYLEMSRSNNQEPVSVEQCPFHQQSSSKGRVGHCDMTKALSHSGKMKGNSLWDWIRGTYLWKEKFAETVYLYYKFLRLLPPKQDHVSLHENPDGWECRGDNYISLPSWKKPTEQSQVTVINLEYRCRN